MKKRRKRNTREQSWKDTEKFWHYELSHLIVQRIIKETKPWDRQKTEAFYEHTIENATKMGDTPSLVKALMEQSWMHSGCPFFRIWPRLTPYLARLNDKNVLGELVHLPFPVFAMFFHDEERELVADNGCKIRSILFGWPERFSKPLPGEKSGEEMKEDGLLLVIDIGESYKGAPLTTWFNMPLRPKEPIYDTVEKLRDAKQMDADLGKEVPHDLVANAIRVALSICFMTQGEDDSVLSRYIEEPAVYSKGRGKPKLLKEAKVSDNAFDVGKEFVVQPHWRSASPLALYWTGKGRKIPKLRYRRGCVVKRKKVKIEFEKPGG